VVVNLKPPTAPTPLTAAVAKAAPPAEPPVARPITRPIAHGASPYGVQLGASPGQDDAKGLLARVQKKFAGPLGGFKAEVVSAAVDGKTVYRVVISGFGGQADATTLCHRLKAAGQACFVRR
jgi:D-alanyl-D-alanine carboxypeptidase